MKAYNQSALRRELEMDILQLIKEFQKNTDRDTEVKLGHTFEKCEDGSVKRVVNGVFVSTQPAIYRLDENS